MAMFIREHHLMCYHVKTNVSEAVNRVKFVGHGRPNPTGILVITAPKRDVATLFNQLYLKGFFFTNPLAV